MSKSSAESIAGVENQHVFITKTQQQQHEYTRGFPYSSFKIDKNVFIFIVSTDSGRAVSTWHSKPEGLECQVLTARPLSVERSALGTPNLKVWGSILGVFTLFTFAPYLFIAVSFMSCEIYFQTWRSCWLAGDCRLGRAAAGEAWMATTSGQAGRNLCVRSAVGLAGLDFQLRNVKRALGGSAGSC